MPTVSSRSLFTQHAGVSDKACWLEFAPGGGAFGLLVTHMSALSGIPVCDDKNVLSEDVASPCSGLLVLFNRACFVTVLRITEEGEKIFTSSAGKAGS